MYLTEWQVCQAHFGFMTLWNTVKGEDNTRELSAYFKDLGTEVIFELNPGNHFTDTIFRSAKGIKAIL